MEVAILQPYDCLKRHPHQHHQRRRFSSVNSNVSPNANLNRSNRRRRNSPPPPQQSQFFQNGLTKAQQGRPKSPPLMGQVRILKRGEDLTRSLPTSPTPHFMVPEPEITRSKSGPVLDGFYAGSAFVTSPSPSEVPLPAFFGKKTGGDAHNQEIACELRRVLKLS